MTRVRGLRAPALALAAFAAVVLLGGCTSDSTTTGSQSPSAATAAASESASAEPSASSTLRVGTVPEWCAAYVDVTGVLAQVGADPATADQAAAVLDDFSALWAQAGDLGIVSVEEVVANQRTVEALRGVLETYAAGLATDSPEALAAREQLTTVTTEEQLALATSAEEVAAACQVQESGAPAESGAPDEDGGPTP
ncbi:MAG: hypothetical protein R2737_18535 [Candidatus Nanopelagicales bacterium]